MIVSAIKVLTCKIQTKIKPNKPIKLLNMLQHTINGKAAHACENEHEKFEQTHLKCSMTETAL